MLSLLTLVCLCGVHALPSTLKQYCSKGSKDFNMSYKVQSVQSKQLCVVLGMMLKMWDNKQRAELGMRTIKEQALDFIKVKFRKHEIDITVTMHVSKVLLQDLFKLYAILHSANWCCQPDMEWIYNGKFLM